MQKQDAPLREMYVVGSVEFDAMTGVKRKVWSVFAKHGKYYHYGYFSTEAEANVECRKMNARPGVMSENQEYPEAFAEVDRITKDARYWKENQLRLAAEVERLTRELGEWKELAHSQQRTFGELLGERNATVNRLRDVENDREAVAAERDAAIELASRMRDSLIGPSGATPRRVKLVAEFDRLYRKSLVPERGDVT